MKKTKFMKKLKPDIMKKPNITERNELSGAFPWGFPLGLSLGAFPWGFPLGLSSS
jgi:hypothetical protein